MCVRTGSARIGIVNRILYGQVPCAQVRVVYCWSTSGYLLRLARAKCGCYGYVSRVETVKICPTRNFNRDKEVVLLSWHERADLYRAGRVWRNVDCHIIEVNAGLTPRV